MSVDRTDQTNTLEMLKDLELFDSDHQFALESHPCGCIWMTATDWRRGSYATAVGFDTARECIMHREGYIQR